MLVDVILVPLLLTLNRQSTCHMIRFSVVNHAQSYKSATKNLFKIFVLVITCPSAFLKTKTKYEATG